MRYCHGTQLPVWHPGQAIEPEPVDAIDEIGYGYDGYINTVHVQPYRQNPHRPLTYHPVGQSYRIGIAHLNRLLAR